MSEKKMIATREGFGKEIVALGKENPDILVVDIDIGKSCKTGEFRKELPDQYINVGIAEQNGAQNAHILNGLMGSSVVGNEVGKIITVEDHNILNGLGSAVCEVAAEMGKGIVKRVGIQDQFGQSAPYERLLAMNGVTVENITEIAETLVKG